MTNGAIDRESMDSLGGGWGLAGYSNQGDMVDNWRSGLGNLKSFLDAG